MIDLVKLLTDNPNVEALMTEIYNFEESLAKVSSTETLYSVISSLYVYLSWFQLYFRSS